MMNQITLLPYIYRVTRVVRVIDGDTFLLEIDVGFRLYTQQVIRLKDVDCPELVGVSQEEKMAAIDAQVWVKRWLENYLENEDRPVFIATAKDKDHFGRWLAERIWVDGPTKSLSEGLIDAGFAVYSTARSRLKWRDVYLAGGASE